MMDTFFEYYICMWPHTFLPWNHIILVKKFQKNLCIAKMTNFEKFTIIQYLIQLENLQSYYWLVVWGQ